MDPQVIATFIQLVRRAPLNMLTRLARPQSTIDYRTSSSRFATLNDEEKLDAVWACLLVRLLTDEHVVPCVSRLEVSLTMLH